MVSDTIAASNLVVDVPTRGTQVMVNPCGLETTASYLIAGQHTSLQRLSSRWQNNYLTPQKTAENYYMCESLSMRLELGQLYIIYMHLHDPSESCLHSDSIFCGNWDNIHIKYPLFFFNLWPNEVPDNIIIRTFQPNCCVLGLEYYVAIYVRTWSSLIAFFHHSLANK